jgi:hypothetical protein
MGPIPAYFPHTTVDIAVKTIAAACHMNFIGPDSKDFTTPIPIALNANPLDLLDLFSEKYGLDARFEHGIWIFSRQKPGQAVVRFYQLHNTTGQLVDISSPTLNSEISTGGSNGSGSSASAQTTESDFKVEADEIEKHLHGVLQIPSPEGGAIGGEVSFLGDTSEIEVIADDYHQHLAAQVIQELDRPPEQIQFTAQFVETDRNPTSDLGIDWGGQVTVSTNSENFNLNNPLHTIPWPSGVLNSGQLTATMNFLENDTQSVVDNRPSVTGLSNRRAMISATTDLPVSSGTATVSSAAALTQSTLSYIDVGTVLTILPRVLPGPDPLHPLVELNVSLVISTQTGSVNINGNSTPIISPRTFEFTATVPAGETLAIGGFTQDSSTTQARGVPFLGSIPLLGNLFKSSSISKNHQALIVFITPKIIPQGGTGSSLITSDMARTFPFDPDFDRPAFLKTSPATVNAIVASLTGFDRELSALSAYQQQGRDPEEIRTRLGSLSDELGQMESSAKKLRKHHDPAAPALLDQIAQYQEQARRLSFHLMAAAAD